MFMNFSLINYRLNNWNSCKANFQYEIFKKKFFLRWADLVERFDENFTHQQEIIYETGELIANFTPSTLLYSFDALVCPKCFAYDCLFHSCKDKLCFKKLGAHGLMARTI